MTPLFDNIPHLARQGERPGAAVIALNRKRRLAEDGSGVAWRDGATGAWCGAPLSLRRGRGHPTLVAPRPCGRLYPRSVHTPLSLANKPFMSLPRTSHRDESAAIMAQDVMLHCAQPLSAARRQVRGEGGGGQKLVNVLPTHHRLTVRSGLWQDDRLNSCT